MIIYNNQEAPFLNLFSFVSILLKMFWNHWSTNSVMISVSDWQISLLLWAITIPSTNNRRTFDKQYICYFIFFLWSPWAITQNILGFRFLIILFWICIRFDNGLITFYSKCKLSFAEYLSIPILLYDLHNILQTLDLHFCFGNNNNSR